jgi:hypothetical protein
MKKNKILILFIILIFLILILSQNKKVNIPKIIDNKSNEFSNEQIVNIIGYDSDAMEPHISRDGKYLFFNSKDGPNYKEIYYASRINNTNFKFEGEIKNINTKQVDGTPSLTNKNQLFYISTIDYEKGTIYSGFFHNGSITQVKRIQGSINIKKLGWLNMDVWVSPDGNHMYTSHANFRKGPPPTESNIRYAIKEGDKFNIPHNEKELLKNINTNYALEYAPELSDDGLEIFYTQLTMTTPMIVKMYHAKRNSIDTSFNPPKLILEAEITDENSFFEAPTISSDGELLYYHKMNNGIFSIFVQQRN